MSVIPEYEKKSLADVVVDYVKNRVMAGTLKSGDRLIEAEISKEFNISRAPVREAMRILNEQGIVAFSPRKGNHVMEMSTEEVLEIFEIRTTLEVQILKKLVKEKMLTEKDFDHLYKLTNDMKNINDKAETDEEKTYLLNHLDMSFHKYLWSVSGNSRRAQILEGLFYQLLIDMNENIGTLGHSEEKADEHERIIYALKGGDFLTVTLEFQNHLFGYVKETLPADDQKAFSHCLEILC